MEREYTTEESDALLLQEMGLADDNSTTNEEAEETVEVDEAEVDETSEQEEYEEETEEVASKPKKGIAKVLHQRNEARKEAEEAKTLVQELQARLDELTEEGNYGSEEYVQTLVDKRYAEKEALAEHFASNPDIRAYKNEIISYSKEFKLDIENATKLYLAKNAPELLIDVQTKNKQQSKMYGVPAITSKNLKEGQFDYSDREFEEMAKKGLIKF